jgi:signal peptidase II
MLAVIIGLIIVVLDQGTKCAIRQALVFGESLPVIDGCFNLNHVRNTGAVFGVFQSQNEWLVAFSILALVLIAVFYRWLVDQRGVHRLAVGCMLGGIVGNLIDRIKLGWVVDFLDFHSRSLQWHWPSFNIADSAICLGVAIYLISAFLRPAASAGVPKETRPEHARPSS